MPIYPLIFLEGHTASHNFTARSSFPRPRLPNIADRQAHITRLQKSFETVCDEQLAALNERQATYLPTREGIYLEVSGEPACELVTESLESQNDGVRLLNIRTAWTPDNQILKRATVFIPTEARAILANKLAKYAETVTDEKPKGRKFIESIAEFKSALINSFWTDDIALLPNAEKQWCEVWIHSSTHDATDYLVRDRLKKLDILCADGSLSFPERLVMCSKINSNDINTIILSLPYISEIRRCREPSSFFTTLENAEQHEWQNDFLERVSFEDSSVAICIFDTGINRGHPLLSPVLSESSQHTLSPDWGTDDHHGHGTKMAGIATYGNLADALAANGRFTVSHQLESCKILPRQGENPPKLYGLITKMATATVEDAAPDYTRLFCMPITTVGAFQAGAPTSWSGAIDQLASGAHDQRRRLFILAAGNVDPSILHNYPKSCFNTPIPDPAQAWNALTVGAYTKLTQIDRRELPGFAPLAASGDISPFSATSASWDKRWPAKPDIVMEGGNLARNPRATGQASCTEADCLSLLTTSRRLQRHQFEAFNQTSAATALAANMAAEIQARYPNAWPETIRALMIHSAEWTDEMIKSHAQNKKKKEFAALRRICGYGVPSLQRAIHCMENSLTLVAEREILPFKKEGSSYKFNHMHIFELPWPKDVLQQMRDTLVTLRITLSYFVEPSPSGIGWKDKYRYRSHGFKFDINMPGEIKNQFIARISAAANDNEDSDEDNAMGFEGNGTDRWTFGPQSRTAGSIHSDKWTGTAADLAESNLIAVFPQMGWWRTRHQLGKFNNTARYSLVVSLQTEAEGVDLYVPVANQIGIAQPVAVEI
ncbi:S8 family peptidase [Nitratidesulfovibrio vulgaris]|uniref:Subtilisin-like serine protease n=1 Tax=Nitratidesulfovibrio vulgaris (strain DP4) TaxID=391774 RepID=A0A0H3ABR3_NITV4|nr:S8 family peptidase [Nitratidesulfovibrio vulgaris]ABM29787.1 subtilisin-like serine protease [Nitratidesulfovibrio vulgaris DP4]